VRRSGVAPHLAEKIFLSDSGRIPPINDKVPLLQVSSQVRQEAMKVFCQGNGFAMHLERFEVFEDISKWSKSVSPDIVSNLRSLTLEVQWYKGRECVHVFNVRLNSTFDLEIRVMDHLYCPSEHGPADLTSANDDYTKFIVQKGMKNGWAIIHWLLDSPNDVRKAIIGRVEKEVGADDHGEPMHAECDIHDPKAEWLW